MLATNVIGVLRYKPLLAGLIGCWSLNKKHIGTYTGNSIRVRRSSDDAETDAGWSGTALDTAAITTHCGGANAYANYGSVSVYMPITGTAGSTAFRCVKGHTCTAIANAQVSTTLGFPTALFDGSGDRIDITMGISMQLGSGDFRIRFKARFTTLKVCVFVQQYTGSPSSSAFFFQMNNTSGALSAGIYVGAGTAGVCTTANGAVTTATTYDIEYGRSGTSFQLSVDGVSKATATSSATANSSTRNVEFGGTLADGATFTVNGHPWGLSIEPGVAGHTGSFTPDALYTTEGDGFITTIYDQVASDNLIQTTVTKQPRIYNNGSVLTVGQHDGADDFFINTTNTASVTAQTVFIKGKSRVAATLAGGEQIYEHTADANNNKGFYVQFAASTGFGWTVTDGTGNRLVATATDTSDTTTLGVVCGKFDKTQATSAKRRAYYAGAELTAASSTTTGTVGTSAHDAAKFYIGAATAGTANFSRLDLQTILRYESAVSDVNIASISAIL